MRTPLKINEKDCDVKFLKQHTLFSVLDMEQISELEEHLSCTIYVKGQVIFSENAIPFGLFCIYKGKVKLSTSGPMGKEQIVRLANRGDIVGYRALLCGDRYHLTAIALEDCKVFVIDKDYFMKIAMTVPQLTQELFKQMSADLKSAENYIVSLSQKNVRERLAEALLFLQATYGMEDDGATINVRLSREELADLVGTSTESVIRLLSEFNAAKIVSLTGKKIKILEIDRLLKTANLLY